MYWWFWVGGNEWWSVSSGCFCVWAGEGRRSQRTSAAAAAQRRSAQNFTGASVLFREYGTVHQAGGRRTLAQEHSTTRSSTSITNSYATTFRKLEKRSDKMALRMLSEKVMGFAAKQYQAQLTSALSQTGLRYEDLLNEGEHDIAEALTLASPDVITGRTRRIKRALDLGFKRKNLQDYAPGMELDLYKMELYDTVEKIRARDQEYALLNAYNK